jgi:restriction endonuclease S subunit
MELNRMSILNKTDSYILDYNKLNSRLDFIHYHPNFDYLDNLKNINNFQVVKLKDICEEPIISGTTPKNMQYDSLNGIDFIGASHIFDIGIKESQKKASSKYLESEMKNLTIEKGDVLVSIAGTVGRVGIYEKANTSVISQSVARVRLKKDIVLDKYILLFLSSKVGQDLFLKFRHDAGQPNINTDELSELPIILPKDIKLQQEIVNKTYPLLLQIKDLENKQENLDEIYNVLVEKLGFNPNNFNVNNLYFKTDKEDTSSYCRFIDEIDNRFDFIYNSPKVDIVKQLKKFDFITLKDVVTKTIERGKQPKYHESGNGIVVKTSTITHIGINCKKASKIVFDFSEPNSSILELGNILLSSTGIKSIGKICKFDCSTNAIADGHITIITIDTTKYDIDFIIYYMRSILGQLQIEKYWSGSSGQIELNPNEVNKILIPSYKKIPKAKQITIAKQITKIISKYTDVEAKKHQLKSKTYQIFNKEIRKNV